MLVVEVLALLLEGVDAPANVDLHSEIENITNGNAAKKLLN